MLSLTDVSYLIQDVFPPHIRYSHDRLRIHHEIHLTGRKRLLTVSMRGKERERECRPVWVLSLALRAVKRRFHFRMPFVFVLKLSWAAEPYAFNIIARFGKKKGEERKQHFRFLVWKTIWLMCYGKLAQNFNTLPTHSLTLSFPHSTFMHMHVNLIFFPFF